MAGALFQRGEALSPEEQQCAWGAPLAGEVLGSTINNGRSEKGNDLDLTAILTEGRLVQFRALQSSEAQPAECMVQLTSFQASGWATGHFIGSSCREFSDWFLQEVKERGM